MRNNDPSEAIRYRAEQLHSWLATAAPAIVEEQRHLDAESSERAYWHLGYQSALKDILSLVDEGHCINPCPHSSRAHPHPNTLGIATLLP
jgi:hypothetical protein